MPKPTRHGEKARELLARAEKLYLGLTDELQRAVDRLAAGADDIEAKGRAELIRAHRKALQTILDIQVQLFGSANQTSGDQELDLESARKEVFGRLDRIAVSAGNRKPNGGAVS